MTNPLINRIYSERDFLTAEEELFLYENRHKKSCRDRLILAFSPLVGGIAKSLLGYGHSFEDLTSSGFLGLLKGLETFDPHREGSARFATHSSYWIRAEMIDFILSNISIIRVITSQPHKKCFFAIPRFKRKHNIANLTGEWVVLAAKEIGVTERDILDFELRMKPIYSTDTPISDDADAPSIGGLIRDTAESIETILADQQEIDQKFEWIRQSLDGLSERDQDIFLKRYGISIVDGKFFFKDIDDIPTLEDLSVIYKVSRERIRQLEDRTKEKIKAECQ